MPITLNFTTIDACLATTNFVAVSAPIGGFTAESDIPNKQGANGLEFHHTGGGGAGEIRRNFSPSIDVRDQEIGFWFLNAFQNEAGTRLFSAGNANQIAVRLYSGTNAVEYNQDQFIDFQGDWLGGWLFCRASGQDNFDTLISGSWGATQAAAVDGVALIIRQNGSNSGTNDAEHCIDWIHYWDKIIVTGTNGGNPYTLADIFDEAKTFAPTDSDGEWGQIENTENFYRLFCGLEIGDGSTATEFDASNEYLRFSPSSHNFDYDLTIRNGATVNFGEKSVATQATYAKNGIQCTYDNTPLWPDSPAVESRGDLVVQSGGVLNIYQSLIKGWNLINLGSGGSSSIECIGVDFFDNTDTELRSTGVAFSNCRLHFPEGDEAAVGTVFSVPSQFDDVRVFQTTTGLEFQVTMDAIRYRAGDNTTTDLLVADGETVTFQDATFGVGAIPLGVIDGTAAGVALVEGELLDEVGPIAGTAAGVSVNEATLLATADLDGTAAGAATTAGDVDDAAASGPTASIIGTWRHSTGQGFTTTATQIDFDTQVRNDSSTYTKNGSGTYTNVPAGRYLVVYQVAAIATGLNGRGQPVIEALKNGTLIPGSRGSGYNRNTANDAHWSAGVCIFESDGTDDLSFRIFRGTDTNVGTCDAQRSWVHIMSLDDTTDIGEYTVTTTGAVGGATYSTLALATTQEVGTKITRSGSNIELAVGKYLVVGGCWFNNATNRESRFTRYTLDAVHVEGSTGYAYMRNAASPFAAPSSVALIEVLSGTPTLNFQARGPSSGVTPTGSIVGADSGIVVVELNSNAEWYAGEDNTAGESIATTGATNNLSLNRATKRAYAAKFASTNATTVTVDAAIDIFAAASFRALGTTGTRNVREGRFLLNGTEQVRCLTGNYLRGTTTPAASDSAIFPRGLLETSASDAITVSVDKSADAGWNDGAATTQSDEPGAMYLLDLTTVG